MKNINVNKILLGVGIGALLCTSTFFVGCTETPLTNSQMDQIMQVVDNTDQFMTNIAEDLDKMNSELGDIADNVNVLSKEESYDLFKYSVNSLITNKDNVWSNLKVVTSRSDGSSKMIIMYKNDDDHYVSFSQYSGNDKSYYGMKESDFEQSENSFESRVINHIFREWGVTDIIYNLSEESMVCASLLENGNYLLKFSSGDYLSGYDTEFKTIEVEVSADGRLIKASQSSGDNSGNKYLIDHRTQEFAYDQLTESEVLEMMNKVNNPTA